MSECMACRDSRPWHCPQHVTYAPPVSPWLICQRCKTLVEHGGMEVHYGSLHPSAPVSERYL